MAGRSRAVLAVAVLGIILVACAGPKPSTIDDPTTVLQKVVDRMLATKTVHLKLNLAQAGNLIGGPESATAEGDFDIEAGEASLTGRSSEAAARPLTVVIDEGKLFNQLGDVWTVDSVEGLAAILPSKDAVDRELRAIVDDERIRLRLDRLATCPSGDCYTLLIEVPGEAGWDHVASLFKGITDAPEVRPPDLPNTTIRVYADIETFDIVQLEIVMDDRSGRIRLVVDASSHDAEVDIDAPVD